ncbi:MAG: hypothetical protein QXF12_02985 [Candidatus Aenigmatarchaeota archaeon]
MDEKTKAILSKEIAKDFIFFINKVLSGKKTELQYYLTTDEGYIYYTFYNNNDKYEFYHENLWGIPSGQYKIYIENENIFASNKIQNISSPGIKYDEKDQAIKLVFINKSNIIKSKILIEKTENEFWSSLYKSLYENTEDLNLGEYSLNVSDVVVLYAYKIFTNGVNEDDLYIVENQNDKKMFKYDLAFVESFFKNKTVDLEKFTEYDINNNENFFVIPLKSFYNFIEVVSYHREDFHCDIAWNCKSNTGSVYFIYENRHSDNFYGVIYKSDYKKPEKLFISKPKKQKVVNENE